MISFELSAIDVVLTLAVIILLILYLKKSPTESTAKTQPSFAKKVLEKERSTTVVSGKQEEKTDVWKCPHSFGYLGNLPKDASIPSECLTCPRVMECHSKGKSSS